MSNSASFDLVVYGATGFTGRLVCEYLSKRSKSVNGLRWAMAGRSIEKLKKVQGEIGCTDIPLIAADSSSPSSIIKMVEATRLILTTVGPYQKYGEPLFKACAESGTDYVDLTGEPNWLRNMIDAYHTTAEANGARLLSACGFDSIPSELGVWFLQQLAIEKFGTPMPRVRSRVVKFIGGPSGGSVASGMQQMKMAEADAEYARLIRDPFALTPDFKGPDQPNIQKGTTEKDVGPIKPFMLGETDRKIVHRSNFLLGHLYGEDFIYDERQLGEAPKEPVPPPANLPKPGEGPPQHLLDTGSFEILFIGEDNNGNQVRATIKGALEPGYISTSRMITETALGLLENTSLPGGSWTPGAALQGKLVKRLTDFAEISFEAHD